MGEMWAMSDGSILHDVHSPSECAGRGCWVHNPSDHHMVTWRVVFRDDKGTAERMCPHGVGHPDPDDHAFWLTRGRNVGFHGCDGCCADLESPGSHIAP